MAPKTTPTAATVVSLLPRLQDIDTDHRFMALNDLFTALSWGPPGMIAHDHPLASRTVDGIVKCLTDPHDDVQNLAIKW